MNNPLNVVLHDFRLLPYSKKFKESLADIRNISLHLYIPYHDTAIHMTFFFECEGVTWDKWDIQHGKLYLKPQNEFNLFTLALPEMDLETRWDELIAHLRKTLREFAEERSIDTSLIFAGGES